MNGYEESVGKLCEAIQFRQTKFGNNLILIEETLKTLARAYAATGDSEMSLLYFKEVMSIRKEWGTTKMNSNSEA